MNGLTLSRLLRPEFLPALPWTIPVTAQHMLVPLRGVFKTVFAEIAPMRGRTGMGVKMTARHVRSLRERFLAPSTLKPLDAEVRCLDVPFDQVLFGRVIAWYAFAILHGLPCATPWCPTPIWALLDMLEPFPCVVFDGELDYLEFDSSW